VKQLRALLYKEWRDQRTFCLAALAACLLLSLMALRINGVALMRHSMYVDSVLPVCCMIFAIVLATESIARDAHTRVADSLLRLPASRSQVWGAKVVFVLLAVAVLVLLLLPLDYLFALAGNSAHLPDDQALARPQFWALMAALTSASFAFACVLRRPLPSAIAGSLAIAALPLFAGWLPPCTLYDWLFVFLTLWSPTELACLVCAAFLLGSLIAFAVRRADALGWRRSLAAAVGVSIVLVPALYGSARRASASFDITFGDPDARIAHAVPSPDERFVAVQVEHSWLASNAWKAAAGPNIANGVGRSEVWLLDRSRGTWSEIDDCSRQFKFTRRFGLESGPWDARGRLAVFSSPSPFGTSANRVDLIDPITCADVLGPLKSIARLKAIDVETGSIVWYGTSSSSRKAEIVLHWTERGIDFRLDDTDVFVTSPEPGIVFVEREIGLVRHDMASGGETLLRALPNHRYGLGVSPDGNRLAILGSGPTTIIDACDGHTVAVLPGGACLQSWSRVPGRLALVSAFVAPHESSWFALDVHGELQPLPTSLPRCEELGADRILAFDEQRIECMKLDGSEREVLYGARP
jgi:hypothetical protein